MELGELRGISTLFCMLAFTAVVYWAYSPSRVKYFDEAGEIPFLDEDPVQPEDRTEIRK